MEGNASMPAGGIGDSETRPGHRKCVSDTFAFMAGQMDAGASGSSMGRGDVLAEEDGMDPHDDELKLEGEDNLAGSGDEKEGDPKRCKRIMANRQSAQRSRMRKLQYTSDLEKSVSRLHTEISQLNPQVTYLRKQHQDLNTHNRDLRNRINALLQETKYKDEMNHALRNELARLKNGGTAPSDASSGMRQPVSSQIAQALASQNLSTSAGFPASSFLASGSLPTAEQQAQIESAGHRFQLLQQQQGDQAHQQPRSLQGPPQLQQQQPHGMMFASQTMDSASVSSPGNVQWA